MVVSIIFVVFKTMTGMSQRFNEIVIKHSEKTSLIVEMREAMRKRQLVLMNIIALPDYYDRKKSRIEFHSVTAEYIAPRNKLELMDLNIKEKQLLTKLTEFVEFAAPIQNEFLKYITENEDQKLIQEKLSAATAAQNNTIELLSSFLELIENENSNTDKKTTAEYQDALTIIYVESLIAILLSIFIGAYVLNKNKTQSKKIEELAALPADNPSPVLRISSIGHIMFANDPGRKILDAWQCTVGDFAPEKWREALRTKPGHADSKPDIKEIEIESDGRIYSFKVTAIPKSGYVNLYGYDITDLGLASTNRPNTMVFNK